MKLGFFFFFFFGVGRVSHIFCAARMCVSDCAKGCMLGLNLYMYCRLKMKIVPVCGNGHMVTLCDFVGGGGSH